MSTRNDPGAEAAPAPAARPDAGPPAPLSTAIVPEAWAPVPFRLKLTLLATVLLLAVGGYAKYGTPDYRVVAERAKAEAAQQAQAEAQQAPDPAQMEEVLAKLAERLKTQPDDLTGWTMLGRATMVMGKFDQAAAAYQKALALKPDDPRLMTDYAEALGMVANRNLEGEPTRLLDKALAIDANLGKALALSGAAAFDRKDYPTAVKHWEKLVAISAPDAEYLPQVRSGIAEARQTAGMPASTVVPGSAAGAALAQAAPGGAATPGPAAPAAPAASGPLPTIRGTVTLSPAVAAQAKPEDTVFIVARAVDGPRMPLAIVRKQVKDLPVEFSLDDSMAMSPQMKLSSVPQVLVVARVSKSGMATPAAGDLLGQSAPVALGASGVKVEISELVK